MFKENVEKVLMAFNDQSKIVKIGIIRENFNNLFSIGVYLNIDDPYVDCDMYRGENAIIYLSDEFHRTIKSMFNAVDSEIKVTQNNTGKILMISKK